MLTFSAMIAGSFSLGSLMANDIDPGAFTAVRFALATVFVGVLAVSRGLIDATVFRAPWRYLVLGALFGFYFVAMFEALKTAPPISTSAIFTFVPLMTAAVAYPLLGQGLTRRMVIALAIGATGALWVIFRADLSAFLAFELGRGELIFFVGCVLHAIYAPMVRRLNRGETAVVSTLGTVIGGGLVLTVYAWSELTVVEWQVLPTRVWVTLLYTAFFATAVTVVLLQFATLRLPSAKVMAYTYLTPSWVIVWEIALGNGTPPAVLLAGVGLTVLALLMLLRDEPV
jgi:drug/metabolite transporter (DMT)-like permease